jgi:hypothetical protein
MALDLQTGDVISCSTLKSCFVVMQHKRQIYYFFRRTSVNLLLTNYDVYILNDIRYACSTENACVPLDLGQVRQKVQKKN